ncbi:hypothetical protein [Amycolatopsis sp. GM8]|uniref:hypothetical protein n=1 Tax=Amycolatopsis sp. GM8 TaxID=2896530 RepID=UPI001F40AB68|nr:hypothetical protein [Amycolatopsis sp. GM8]
MPARTRRSARGTAPAASKGIRRRIAQASAPATGFSQYCASAKAYYTGLSGDPGGGAVLTQYSGVVCWS